MHLYRNFEGGGMYKMKHIRKKVLALSVFIVAILLLASCGTSTSSDDEQIVWKFSFDNKIDHPWGKTAQKFANLVEKRTDGRIKVKLYPNGQLGGETDIINQIQSGAVDMTITGETMANWAPKAALMSVPYALDSQKQMRKVINGEVGQEIESQVKGKVGVTPLYYHMRSPRNLTSNKPISSPEDLNGFKMRVPDVPLDLNAWKAAGAKPQSMDLGEVFTGLQTGAIEGEENPNDLIADNGFYEVQNYVNLTQHTQSWIYVVVGNKQFNSLDPKLQEDVGKAAKEAQQYGNQLFKEQKEAYKKQLMDEEMEFNDSVDKDAFKQAMIPAVKESLNNEQSKLYKKMLDVE